MDQIYISGFNMTTGKPVSIPVTSLATLQTEKPKEVKIVNVVNDKVVKKTIDFNLSTIRDVLFDEYIGTLNNCILLGDITIKNNCFITLNNTIICGNIKFIGKDNTLVILPSEIYYKSITRNISTYSLGNKIIMPSSLYHPNGFTYEYNSDTEYNDISPIKIVYIYPLTSLQLEITDIIEFVREEINQYGIYVEISGVIDITNITKEEFQSAILSYISEGVKLFIISQKDDEVGWWNELAIEHEWTETGPYLISTNDTTYRTRYNNIVLSSNDIVNISCLRTFMKSNNFDESSSFVFVPNGSYGNGWVQSLQKQTTKIGYYIYNPSEVLNTALYTEYKTIILLNDDSSIDIYNQLRNNQQYTFIFIESNYSPFYLESIHEKDRQRVYFIGYTGEVFGTQNFLSIKFYERYGKTADIYNILFYDATLLCSLINVLQHTSSFREVVQFFNGVTGRISLDGFYRSNGSITITTIIKDDLVLDKYKFIERYIYNISEYVERNNDVFCVLTFTPYLDQSDVSILQQKDDTIKNPIFNRVFIYDYIGTSSIVDNNTSYILRVFPQQTVYMENNEGVLVIPATRSNLEPFQIRYFNKSTPSILITNFIDTILNLTGTGLQVIQQHKLANVVFALRDVLNAIPNISSYTNIIRSNLESLLNPNDPKWVITSNFYDRSFAYNKYFAAGSIRFYLPNETTIRHEGFQLFGSTFSIEDFFIDGNPLSIWRLWGGEQCIISDQYSFSNATHNVRIWMPAAPGYPSNGVFNNVRDLKEWIRNLYGYRATVSTDQRVDPQTKIITTIRSIFVDLVKSSSLTLETIISLINSIYSMFTTLIPDFAIKTMKELIYSIQDVLVRLVDINNITTLVSSLWSLFRDEVLSIISILLTRIIGTPVDVSAFISNLYSLGSATFDIIYDRILTTIKEIQSNINLVIDGLKSFFLSIPIYFRKFLQFFKPLWSPILDYIASSIGSLVVSYVGPISAFISQIVIPIIEELASLVPASAIGLFPTIFINLFNSINLDINSKFNLFIPIINSLRQFINSDFFKAITGAFIRLTSTILSNLVEFMKILLPVLGPINIILDIVTTVLDIGNVLIESVINALSNIIIEIINVIIDAFQPTIQYLVSVISTLTSAVVTALNPIIIAIGSNIQRVVQFALLFISKFDLVSVLQTVITPIKSVVETNIVPFVNGFINIFAGNATIINTFVTTVVNILKNTATIVSLLKSIFEIIKNLISEESVKGIIVVLLGVIIDTVKDILPEIVKGVLSIFTNFVDIFIDFVNNSIIKPFITELNGIGIFQPLFTVIANNGTAIMNIITSLSSVIITLSDVMIQLIGLLSNVIKTVADVLSFIPVLGAIIKPIGIGVSKGILIVKAILLAFRIIVENISAISISVIETINSMNTSTTPATIDSVAETIFASIKATNPTLITNFLLSIKTLLT